MILKLGAKLFISRRDPQVAGNLKKTGFSSNCRHLEIARALTRKCTDMGPAPICRGHLGAGPFGVPNFQGQVVPEIFGAKFKIIFWKSLYSQITQKLRISGLGHPYMG
mgnify:CR=1 FL=1